MWNFLWTRRVSTRLQASDAPVHLIGRCFPSGIISAYSKHCWFYGTVGIRAAIYCVAYHAVPCNPVFLLNCVVSFCLFISVFFNMLYGPVVCTHTAVCYAVCCVAIKQVRKGLKDYSHPWWWFQKRVFRTHGFILIWLNNNICVCQRILVPQIWSISHIIASCPVFSGLQENLLIFSTINKGSHSCDSVKTWLKLKSKYTVGAAILS